MKLRILIQQGLFYYEMYIVCFTQVLKEYSKRFLSTVIQLCGSLMAGCIL